jgi:hypothetical protein
MLPLNARTVCGGMALAACLVSAAFALRGCHPAGLGSIKIGSSSLWHKEPAAPTPSWNPKRATGRTRKVAPADQAPYKSVKDQMKERAMSPG